MNFTSECFIFVEQTAELRASQSTSLTQQQGEVQQPPMQGVIYAGAPMPSISAG